MTDRTSSIDLKTTPLAPASIKEFVNQLNSSVHRNENDESTNSGWQTADRLGAANAHELLTAEQSVAKKLAAGDKPAAKEIANLQDLLGRSDKLLTADWAGDIGAYRKDLRDIDAEGRFKKAARAVADDPTMPARLRAAAEAGVVSKNTLLAIEREDFAKETNYAQHDLRGIATNGALEKSLTALKTGTGSQNDVINLLGHSTKAQRAIRNDRIEDGGTGASRGDEGRYNAIDNADDKINDNIRQALKATPYLYHHR
jgi:hypothetical protein